MAIKTQKKEYKSTHSRVPLHFVPKLMVKSPDIILYIMKFMFLRRMFLHFDHILEKRPLVPLQVSIKITNLCNLRCKMCGQWGESGYNIGKSLNEINEVVPLDDYKRMVDEIAPIKPWIYIWGGEPFLYPDLIPLVNYMKKKGLKLSLVTNGVRLEESAEEIVANQWDSLMLSLDGDRETHDEVRGRVGTFDKLIAGIEAIKRERKKRNSFKPHLMVLTTMSRDNAPYFYKIFDVANDIGVDCVIAYYSWFTTQKLGELHQKLMKERLNCEATAWRGYVYDFTKIETDLLQESIKRIHNTKYNFPYLFIPNLKFEDIPTYYLEPNNFFGYNKCITPWFVPELMPNGDVATCRDYPDFITGNIRKQSLLEIFNGERYKLFRRTLREKGMFPVCARCCGLMGF